MQDIGDLSWLQYVCYGLWVLAAVLYLSARTDVRGIRRPLKIAAASLCIFIGMCAWTVQEHHSQTYSPRETATGVVTWVIENRNKGGSFSDDLMLYRTDGALTPTLSTGILGGDHSQRPIAKGDVLSVRYRAWDDKIMSFDEVNGSHQGWKYRYSPQGFGMVYAGAAVAAGGFLWLLFAWRSYNEGDELVYQDDLPNQASEIQTLGLDGNTPAGAE